MLVLFFVKKLLRILVSLEPESMAADNPNLIKLCIVMTHLRDSHTPVKQISSPLRKPLQT